MQPGASNKRTPRAKIAVEMDCIRGLVAFRQDADDEAGTEQPAALYRLQGVNFTTCQNGLSCALVTQAVNHYRSVNRSNRYRE